MAGVLLAGCRYEFPAPAKNADSGDLSLKSVIFVGDDYLSGFMDGALYSEGQQHGISAILAGTFGDAGMEAFVQADIGAVNGYNFYVSDSGNIKGKYVLVYAEPIDQEPVITVLPGEPVEDYNGDKTLVTDLSIPFLKSFQFGWQTVPDNIYYPRIAANPGTFSLLDQVAIHHPETFVLWMGMSDLLGYAVSGGAGDSIPVSSPRLFGPDDLTPVAVYRTALEEVVSALLVEPQAKGVIFTLPSFEDLPFFYYYSYDFMKLTGSQLGLANTFYADFNNAVLINNMTSGNPQRPFIGFNDNGYTQYPQSLVVTDYSLPDAYYPDGIPLPKIRNLAEGEKLLLDIPVDKITQGYGWLVPVEEKYYLNLAQVRTLQNRVVAYNQAIEDVAAMYPGRLAVADIRETIHNIAETGKLNGWGKPSSSEEYHFDGVPLTGRLGLNSIFSLDGLHFNQRGSAYVSFLAVKAINDAFGASLSLVDVNDFKGNIPRY
ncbi:MAG: hypothetical protein GXO83_06275 [Chlorobi bacterium]|nr:hypothetical protein [Chlorobiota bacterium]